MGQVSRLLIKFSNDLLFSNAKSVLGLVEKRWFSPFSFSPLSLNCSLTALHRTRFLRWKCILSDIRSRWYYEQDLEALEDGGWISDHIMGIFLPPLRVLIAIGADVYYDYLEADVLNQEERFRRSVLLVRPTIAYLIRHSRGWSSSTPIPTHGLIRRYPKLDVSTPKSRKRKLHVWVIDVFSYYSFFPINDNDDPSGHGGSHWYSFLRSKQRWLSQGLCLLSIARLELGCTMTLWINGTRKLRKLPSVKSAPYWINVTCPDCTIADILPWHMFVNPVHNKRMYLTAAFMFSTTPVSSSKE